MAQTQHIVSGLLNSWTDYSQTNLQQRTFTLENRDAGIWTNFIAVDLTLTAPWVFILFQRLIEVIWTSCEKWSRKRKARRQRNANNQPREDSPLLERAASVISTSTSQELRSTNGEFENADTEEGDRGIDGANPSRQISHDGQNASHDGASGTQPGNSLNEFMLKKTPQAATSKLAKFIVGELFFHSPDSPRNWGKIWGCSILALFCAALFGGLAYATIMSVRIASGSIVLSDSPNCGVWRLSPLVRNRISEFSYMQEVETRDVAKRCYLKDPATRCNDFFIESTLSFKETSNSTCPFAEGFCLEGNQAAYTLSTDLISSKSLGINVPIGYTFNRTTTCAPIQKDDYIEYEWYNKTEETLVKYFYGSRGVLSPENYTFLTVVRNVLFDPGYVVRSFHTSSLDYQGWQPIDEFRHGKGSQVTLLTVQSLLNLHLSPRDDPVFPAMSPILVYPEENVYFFNNERPASVLACVDRASICDESGNHCWNAEDSPPGEFVLTSQIEQDGYYMLQIALSRSTIYDSIAYQGGDALDVKTKLNGFFSLPLAIEQWKVEARNLFAASLARIQIDLRDHIRGNAAGQPGFGNYTDPAHRGMCKMYRFHGTGYTNFMVWPSVSLLLGSFLIFVLSFKKDMREEIDGKQVVKRRFWVEVIIVCVCRFIVYLAITIHEHFFGMLTMAKESLKPVQLYLAQIHR